MFDAHIDQIGMVVTEIDDGGFIHVMNVGGIDRRTMPGARVTVFGEEKLTGIVCVLPPHISGGDDKIPAVDEQVIDVGLTKEEAEKIIKEASDYKIAAQRNAKRESDAFKSSINNRSDSIIEDLKKTIRKQILGK